MRGSKGTSRASRSEKAGNAHPVQGNREWKGNQVTIKRGGRGRSGCGKKRERERDRVRREQTQEGRRHNASN
jgi:hypothetical protein